MTIRVVIQQHRRLFREGIELLLDSDPEMIVLGAVDTGPELVKLFPEVGADVALIELDDGGDACETAAAIRALDANVRFVGVYNDEMDEAALRRIRAAGFPSMVRRADGLRPLVQAIRSSLDRRPVPIAVPSGPSGREVLTPREVAVLSLVGAGCTTREISDRLSISRKTVENHKQHIFGKLNVQNQAHAVAVAMREGIVAADGILDLTDP